jgi:membrane protein
MATNRFSRLTKILGGTQSGAPGEAPRRESELSRWEHFAHFWIHVRQNFVRNRCLIRASALSFSTLLAIIPMLAVAISVTSSLLKSEGEDQIYHAINKVVAALMPPATVSTNPPDAGALPKITAETAATPANPATVLVTNLVATAVTNAVAGTNAVAATTDLGDDARVITAQKEAAKSIHDFVQNTRSGTLGIVGMLLLVYVAISMLANIEATFNDIWGVNRGRKWLWRIFLYWGVLTLGPLALICASSLAGSSHLDAAHHLISRTPFIGRLGFELLPLLIVWLVFTLIYLTVPNTKVYFGSALVGGVVAGSLWQLNNFLGYLYVSRVITDSKIYGSLGLVPVFMAGLYCSWVVLLFGVQVSCAFQNRKSYIQEKFAENVNQRGREFIALRLMTCLGLRFQNGLPAASTPQIAAELGVSPRLTQEITQPLLAAHLIAEVSGTEPAYLPARPLEAINAHQVLLALRSVNQPVVFTREEPVRDEIYGEFARIEEAERVAAAAVTLQALVNRARSRMERPALSRPGPVRALAEFTATVAEPAGRPETGALEIESAPVTVAPDPVAKAGRETGAADAVPAKPVRGFAGPGEDYDFPL